MAVRTSTSCPRCRKLTPCFSPSWCFALPPRLSLFCDEHGKPVCEAAAGKPPAQLSWLLESNSSLEEESHDNGTATVLSRLTACDTNVTDTTCVVFHPAGSWSESIACCPSEIGSFLHCVISLMSLLGLFFLQAVFHLYTFCGSRYIWSMAISGHAHVRSQT
ncbi:cell surface glycoprotein CD200 receptor 1-A-like [Manacus candei]|uniref:cell surface glycoprotein CD200 receptor 1-A-like n=1 Tax=Manacus candei TaxID=415023 RepID=UPI002226810B|nr:cell surface glycoprotein CD200 receptor 1-A-like [Manacus candei]